MPEYKVIRASDVSDRDGIGVELYKNGECIIEIFRDDSEKTRTVTILKDNVSLSEMEKAIDEFKKGIPWEFIEYEE
jgi:hypothetical protein